MSDRRNRLPIGAVAERTGLNVSAIRFYESTGLIRSERAASGHRRFARSTIRRVSFIRICQNLGYSLEEIRSHLDLLPASRTPTEQDWQTLSRQFSRDIEARVSALEQLKDRLDSCIGCGCLSLNNCALWNSDDQAAALGAGPRWLMGDSPPGTQKEP